MTRMVRGILSIALLLSPFATQADPKGQDPNKFPFLEATVAQLEAEMAAGHLTSEQLTRAYIERIQQLDQPGPETGLGVNAIIELNPDAIAIAKQMDQLRRKGTVLGPMHGIPVLLKANVDTHDKMQTTAGSLALQGTPALHDSTVAANLRAGGAVILGKTNLSEWANFRSFFSISGWSGVGGQTHNPYGIDRNPCGSSSGSGAAASANFATVSFGTETDGSIVCPANANGVVGIKPTVGLTSRAGVVPISHTQDTVGPHGRTVADAAIALGVIQSRTFDGRDPATGGVPLGWQGRFPRPTNIPTDYTQFLNPNALKGARLGLVRSQIGLDGAPAQVIAAFDDVVSALEAAGATIIDLDAQNFTFPPATAELFVLEFDFKNDVQSYFATRVGVPMAGKTLADAIAFDNANADAEMPFFAQEIFDEAEALLPGADTPQTDPNLGVPVGTTYNEGLKIDHDATVNGIDLALSTFHLDAVIAPTDNPAWSTDLLYGDHFVFGSSGLGAPGGYPYVQVPAANVFGIPFGLTFFGTAFSEPTLIALASGFEAVRNERAKNLPQFTPTIPDDHIAGEALNTKKLKHHKKPAGWHPRHM
ncbi:MAG TPA: amidase family protein [Steroidobacteraceae bacterium]|nr:amidase family protein [Steroidobacteraceae bacterium]